METPTGQVQPRRQDSFVSQLPGKDYSICSGEADRPHFSFHSALCPRAQFPGQHSQERLELPFLTGPQWQGRGSTWAQQASHTEFLTALAPAHWEGRNSTWGRHQEDQRLPASSSIILGQQRRHAKTGHSSYPQSRPVVKKFCPEREAATRTESSEVIHRNWRYLEQRTGKMKS